MYQAYYNGRKIGKPVNRQMMELLGSHCLLNVFWVNV